MVPVAVPKKLESRLARDQRNAEVAAVAAVAELNSFRPPHVPADSRFGLTAYDKRRLDYSDKRKAALEAMSDEPFQVMVEVSTELVAEGGKSIEKNQLWYANVDSFANEVLGGVAVLAWTHPGLQLALSNDLGEYSDLGANGYRLLGVEPRAKARFDATLPNISGVYQPGGAVRPRKPAAPKTGLKAVKLDMTRDQVSAFVSRMSGLLVVTGAPGSGKTTIAFQRIRFLLDQQDQRQSDGPLVSYTTDLTRVFLANENLAVLAKALLVNQLGISDSVVERVGDFISAYLDQVWLYKHNARPRQRRLLPLEAAARTAVLGLSDHNDLGRLWQIYEHQIADRLSSGAEPSWLKLDQKNFDRLNSLASKLASAGERAARGSDPLRSKLTMDALYSEVADTYTVAREGMPTPVRDRFDELFQQWLYHVYDPLSALATYFGGRVSEAAYRIRRGTGSRVDEAAILTSAIAEWAERGYGPEDRPWLAWLLRFALPEPLDPQRRFREAPSSIAPATAQGLRWSHIVIDEAQDLSVAEASLIGSLVDPDGALTVSADFRQIVSPVYGMRSTDALRVGRSLRGKTTEQIYPFARNMRQSSQIGRFLQGFYEAAFKERPTFEVNTTLQDKKPQLIIASPQQHALRIKQLVSVLRRSEVVQSVALLQINEDEQSMLRVRSELGELGVPLAAIWAASGEGLLTTSVERIKGLEFDACLVLGLEDVENAALNFTLNRAYVAASRPTRRLAFICDEFPSLLRALDASLLRSHSRNAKVNSPLFPAFEKFVERNRLLDNAKGILAARLPRILGQGRTRAEGLDMAPAAIERQQELIALSLPAHVALDPAVEEEVQKASRIVKLHVERMQSAENRRRFALEVLQKLDGISTGVKDNQFYAGRLILVSDGQGLNWAWSMTPHYPVIAKIPADVEYVMCAYTAAEQIVEKWTLPVEIFLDRLRLAWAIARHFEDKRADVLIADVARVYKVAAQNERFWNTPARRNFEDVPDAVFIANLINWRRNRDAVKQGVSFELVPATVNQAHGPNARAFFVPDNPEGTVVRPMIYMRREVA